MQGRRTILEERQKFFTNTWERSRKRFTDSVHDAPPFAWVHHRSRHGRTLVGLNWLFDDLSCDAPLHRVMSKYHRLSRYPT